MALIGSRGSRWPSRALTSGLTVHSSAEVRSVRAIEALTVAVYPGRLASFVEGVRAWVSGRS